jgi:hypothetical protein
VQFRVKELATLADRSKQSEAACLRKLAVPFGTYLNHPHCASSAKRMKIDSSCLNRGPEGMKFPMALQRARKGRFGRAQKPGQETVSVAFGTAISAGRDYHWSADAAGARKSIVPRSR